MLNTSFFHSEIFKDFTTQLEARKLSWMPHASIPSCFIPAFNKEYEKKKVVRNF
jgi:hypothetical protein